MKVTITNLLAEFFHRFCLAVTKIKSYTFPNDYAHTKIHLASN